MKMKKLISSLLAVFAGIVLFVPSHALAAAFGISPPWIVNENLRPGDNLVYAINLSSNGLAEDMTIDTRFEGDPKIAQWLTVMNKAELVMKEGKSTVPMLIGVNIPEDAKIGRYTGNLRVNTVSTTGNQANVAVLLGGNIDINLNIIDYDVTDYWIQSIVTEPITEGQDIDLRIRVKNIGNTNVDSIMTTASIVDFKTGAELVNTSAEKLSIVVYPQVIAEPILTIKAPQLTAGNYWLNVESFKDNESIYKSRIYLTVVPSSVNNSTQTSVEVAAEGWVKPAAPAEVVPVMMNDEGQNAKGRDASVTTSVNVRAPLTNQLIVVIIAMLVILTGIVVKIYSVLKNKKR